MSAARQISANVYGPAVRTVAALPCPQKDFFVPLASWSTDTL
jgi:hypothetical protein